MTRLRITVHNPEVGGDEVSRKQGGCYCEGSGSPSDLWT